MCVVNSVLLTLLELLLLGLVLLLFAPDLVLPLLDVRHALEQVLFKQRTGTVQTPNTRRQYFVQCTSQKVIALCQSLRQHFVLRFGCVIALNSSANYI